MRKCRKSLPRADLRALRYRRRKARKFRTWTFSAGAFFAREMRKGRRGICYAVVAKHACCARKVFSGDRYFTPWMRTGWLHAAQAPALRGGRPGMAQGFAGSEMTL